jgi:hypothetical protein
MHARVQLTASPDPSSAADTHLRAQLAVAGLASGAFRRRHLPPSLMQCNSHSMARQNPIFRFLFVVALALHIRPVRRRLEHLHQLFLARPRPGRAHIRHVLPPCRLRQTTDRARSAHVHRKKAGDENAPHQDTLDPRAGGKQAKLGAPIVDQVELDIPPAAHELPAAFFLRKRHVDPAVHDGDVRVEEGRGHALDEAEDVIRGRLGRGGGCWS